ncbi:MAG: hypothetical protein ACRCXD_01610 [Luteolibacter sp.]
MSLLVTLVAKIGFLSAQNTGESNQASWLAICWRQTRMSLKPSIRFLHVCESLAILDQYPGQRFQTGLFGTWMFAKNDAPPPLKLYSDIEDGLGWWRDTEFATDTPKFITGGDGKPVISGYGRERGQRPKFRLAHE